MMVHAGTAYQHLFHTAGKFCDVHLRHVASVLVLDAYQHLFIMIITSAKEDMLALLFVCLFVY